MVELPVIPSIAEEAGDQHIMTYPNPASEVVSIQRTAEGPAEISIVDALGCTVHRSKIAGDLLQIDVSQWNAGIFI